MGPIANMLTDLANRRAVRSQARECRKQGMTDHMRDTTLSVVCEVARAVGDDDEPSESYLKSWFNGHLSQSLPGLDPATILLLVQLAIMIYQALKAVGFLGRDGLSAVSPATINEHFGGL